MHASEKSLMQRLNRSQADLAELRDAAENQSDVEKRNSEAIAARDAKVKLLTLLSLLVGNVDMYFRKWPLFV